MGTIAFTTVGIQRINLQRSSCFNKTVAACKVAIVDQGFLHAGQTEETHQKSGSGESQSAKVPASGSDTKSLLVFIENILSKYFFCSGPQQEYWVC